MPKVPLLPRSSRRCARERMDAALSGKRPLRKTRPHVESGRVSWSSSCQSVSEAVKPSFPKSRDFAGRDSSHVVKHCPAGSQR